MLAELLSRNGHVDPAPPEPDLLSHVSVSRLKAFLGCRLRFYFERVARISKPVSPSLHLGRAVHAAIQAYNTACWRGEDSSEPSVIGAYHAAFDAACADPVEWEDEAEKASLRDRGELVLHAYLAAQVNRPEVRPIGVELKLRAEIPGIDLPLVGVIDLIRSDNIAVDYKTVASTPDLDLETWQHELQLTAYTLLVEDGTGMPSPGNELVFLVKTKTPKVIHHRIGPPNQVQRDRLARLVSVYAEGVSRGQWFPSPGAHCAWCPYRTECLAHP